MIRGISEFPKLLGVLAARACSLLNLTDISRNSGIQQDTLKRFYLLLQALFLIIELPAWFANLGKRLIKAPKISLADIGVWADILGVVLYTGKSAAPFSDGLWALPIQFLCRGGA